VLIVIARTDPHERVLAACKTDSRAGGDSTTEASCLNLACSDCAGTGGS